MIPADDRGLAYGDGLFETMWVEAGKVRLLDYHLERLAEGFRRLGFPPHQLADIKRQLLVAVAERSNPLKTATGRTTQEAEATQEATQGSISKATQPTSPSIGEEATAEAAQEATGEVAQEATGEATSEVKQEATRKPTQGATQGATEVDSSRWIVKLIVTRGSGGRGYAPPPQPSLRHLLQWLPPVPAYATQARNGIRVAWCSTRLGQTEIGGIKTLNRLEQVLAKQQVGASDEGLMCDFAGNVVCATAANLFVVVGETLLTPPVEKAGIRGVMRRYVIERLAPLVGKKVVVKPITTEMVAGASEVFITNALRGIHPVVAVDSQSLAIGKLTTALQQALLESKG